MDKFKRELKKKIHMEGKKQGISSEVELLTGSDLKEFIYNLLTDSSYDLKRVKYTTIRKNLLLVHIIRSYPFEDIISLLSDRLKVATISNQHNVILILLNNILFDGKVINYDRRIGTRFVDLTYKGS
ncbi:MAG: hypothetical protein ACTSR3_22965, partial [Candidatus Helarchaeota archaeon]